MNFYQRMGILPLKKRVNRDKCSFTTKQRMFLGYRWDPSLSMNPVRQFAHFMSPWDLPELRFFSSQSFAFGCWKKVVLKTVKSHAVNNNCLQTMHFLSQCVPLHFSGITLISIPAEKVSATKSTPESIHCKTYRRYLQSQTRPTKCGQSPDVYNQVCLCSPLFIFSCFSRAVFSLSLVTF